MHDRLRCSKALRGFLAALAGFVVYGGWALFVNYQHGLSTALEAGLTQGSYSFTVTLTMTLFMEWLFGLSDTPELQFSLTFLVTCLLLYTTAWGVNALTGTPEILLTILPGALFGTLYTLSYTLALFKIRQPSATSSRP